MTRFWLSFVDESLEKATGVCVIRAEGPDAALRRAKELGCCPGGACMIVELGAGGAPDIPENRLLQGQELRNAGWGKQWSDLGQDEKDAYLNATIHEEKES